MKNFNVRMTGQLLLLIVTVLVLAVGAHAVDYTPPTVQLTHPVNNQAVGENTYLSASAWDPESGIWYVSYYLDGTGPIANITCSPSNPTYYQSVTTKDLDQTWHTVTAYAINTAGTFSAPHTVSVLVDRTAPTATLNVPQAGDTLSGTVTFSATASDALSGIDQVWFYVDGNPLTPAYLEGGQYVFPLITSGVTSSTHTVRARAYDRAGNYQDTPTITVLVDNTAPTVYIATPPDGATVGEMVLVSAIAQDNPSGSGVDRVAFFLDDIQEPFAIDDEPPYEQDCTTENLDPGEHTLHAIAHDAAGNFQPSVPITVIVPDDIDETPPTVSLAEPRNGDILQNTVDFKATAYDAESGVHRVVFWVGGTPTATVYYDGDQTYEHPIITNNVDDGPYTVFARAVDNADNVTNTPPVNVIVDNDDPTVSIARPEEGEIVGEFVTVVADADDGNGSGIDRVAFYLDGTKKFAVDDTYPYEQDCTTAKLDDGPHTIHAVAYDSADHSAHSDTTTVIVANGDTTPPTVSITEPLDGDSVSGTIDIKADARDDESGIDRVVFFVDDDPLFTDSTRPYVSTVITNSVSNGEHYIYARAFDYADNFANSETITVDVDNIENRILTYPKVRLIAPEHGDALTGTVNFVAAAYDTESGIDYVAFWINGEPLAQVHEISQDPQYAELTDPYVHPIITSGVTDGGYYIQARAYNNDGLCSISQTIFVTVDNVGIPTIQLLAPADGDIVRGTVGVSVDADDDGSGVDSVVFYLDGDRYWRDPSEPWDSDWDTRLVSDGPHTISAIAYDFVGHSATSNSVGIIIDNEQPTAAISEPIPGEILTKTYDIKATATDDVSGVAKVVFVADGTDFFTDKSSPYASTVTTTQVSDGSYRLQARAVDLAGNVFVSAPVTIYVANNGFDETPPTVQIDEPLPGTEVRDVVWVKVRATDDANGIDSVVFWCGDTRVNEDTEPDAEGYYGGPWDSRTVEDGTYDFRAVAYDRFDNAGTASISFHVANGAGYNIYGNTLIGDVLVTTGTLSAVSNEDGSYVIENVQPGTWFVSASKDDCLFTPASWTVNITDASWEEVDFATPCELDFEAQDDCFALQYLINYKNGFYQMNQFEADVVAYVPCQYFWSCYPSSCSPSSSSPPECRPNLPLWKYTGTYVPDFSATQFDCYGNLYKPFTRELQDRYNYVPKELNDRDSDLDWDTYMDYIVFCCDPPFDGKFLVLYSEGGGWVYYQDRLRIVDPIAWQKPYCAAIGDGNCYQCDPDDDYGFEPYHHGEGVRNVYPFEVTSDGWGMLPFDETYIGGQGVILTKPGQILGDNAAEHLGSSVNEGDAIVQLRILNWMDPEDYTCGDNYASACDDLLFSASTSQNEDAYEPQLALPSYDINNPLCYRIDDRTVAYDYEGDGVWDEIFITGFFTHVTWGGMPVLEQGLWDAIAWATYKDWFFLNSDHDNTTFYNAPVNRVINWMLENQVYLSDDFWLRGHSLGAMEAILIANIFPHPELIDRVTTYGVAAGTPSEAITYLENRGIYDVEVFLAFNDQPLTRSNTFANIQNALASSYAEFYPVATSDWYITGNNPHDRVLYQQAAEAETGRPHPVR